MKKKIGGIILAAFLVCALGLPGAWAESGTEEPALSTGYDERLDEAFAGKKSLRLEPVPLLTDEERQKMEDQQLTRFIGMSPDGQTLLYIRETGDQGTGLCLVRGGEITPVRLVEDKGVGDPNGEFDFYRQQLFNNLPFLDGISWSADGRYATFSDLRYSAQKMQSTDVPVLDTATGELWLADSWPSGRENVKSDSFGLVFLSKLSRKGDYLYYLKKDRQSEGSYQFCRCAPDGSGREVLYEIPGGDQQFYDLLTGSTMFEDADGSWLLVGVNGKTSDNSRFNLVSLVRFAPGEDGAWSAESLLPGNIPARAVSPVKTEYSPVSGYGLIYLQSQTASQMSAAATVDAVAETPVQAPVSVYASHVNLLRVLPGNDGSGDIWYLREKSEDPADLEFVPGEEFLHWIQMKLLGMEPLEIEGFDPVLCMRRGIPMVSNFCISPDGRYALLHVRLCDEERSFRIYMVRLSDMEILPVTAPEGIGDMVLIAGAPYGGQFWPGMVWNRDGTLLILSADQGVMPLRLEAE